MQDRHQRSSSSC